MKKNLFITLLIVVITSLFVGCGNESNSTSSNSTNEDIIASVKKNDSIYAMLPDKVKNAGKISIGLDDAYPPMEFRDDTNSLVGFDIDFGNAIGQKLGMNVEWVTTAWDGILPALKSGKFDMIISALSITEERKKEIGYSKPYIAGGPIIIINKDNTSIKSSEDLKDKVIGVQLGSTSEFAANKINGVKEVKKYNKVTEALMDLKAKRIDTVVADDQVGRYYAGLDANKYYVIGKLNEEPFGIGFRKEDTVLINAIQKAIDDLKVDGTLSKISLKWFKTDYYK